MLALTLLIATFSSVVSGWGFGAYTDIDCFSGPAGYTWTLYSGWDEDFTQCIVVGENVDDRFDCHHQDDLPCTGPMSPAPLSVWYTEDSDCCVGYSVDCYYNTCDFAGNQCLWTYGMPGGSSPHLTFKCKNKPGMRPMKLIMNGTHPVEVPVE